MDNNKKPLLIPPLDNIFLHVDILVWPKGKNGVVIRFFQQSFTWKMEMETWVS